MWAYIVPDADVEYVVKAQQTSAASGSTNARESQAVSQQASAASGSNDAQALQEVSQDGLKYCRNINAVAARVIREHAERERTRQLLRKKEADSVFENLGTSTNWMKGISHTKMMRPQLRTRTLNPIGQSGMSPQQRAQRAQRMPE